MSIPGQLPHFLIGHTLAGNSEEITKARAALKSPDQKNTYNKALQFKTETATRLVFTRLNETHPEKMVAILTKEEFAKLSVFSKWKAKKTHVSIRLNETRAEYHLNINSFIKRFIDTCEDEGKRDQLKRKFKSLVGEVHSAERDLAKAEKNENITTKRTKLQEAQSALDDFINNLDEIKISSPEELVELAIPLRNNKIFEEAITLYKLAAAENYQTAKEHLSMLGNDLKELSSQYLKKNNEASQAESIRLLKLAVDTGNAEAQFRLGLIHQLRRGVAKDEAEAARLYRLAADQGLAKAQCKLGTLYQYGQGVEQNTTEAIRFYKLAAAQGDQQAKNYLSLLAKELNELATKQKVNKQEAEAITLLKLAAETGDAKAQYNLGIMYENGQGVDKNEAEAIRFYHLAAAQGDQQAKDQLSLLGENLNSVGVKKHLSGQFEEAVKLYRLAAETGYTYAQYNLAIMYGNGKGVDKDEVEAARLYRLVADTGDAKAQYYLALMYENGKGVAKDEAEAFRLLKLAAKSGNIKAINHLGVKYQYGEGIDKNEAEAARLYRLAADKGLDLAQFNMGLIYENGIGVDKDAAEAIRFYKLAAAQNNEDAKGNLSHLGNHLYKLAIQYQEDDNKNEVEAFRLLTLAAETGMLMHNFT